MKGKEEKKEKVSIVMPAYRAVHTLQPTLAGLPRVYDEIILCDDGSTDGTYELAKSISGITVIRHEKNQGYGANQKTLYDLALKNGAGVIVMVHPDNQYEVSGLTQMISLVREGKSGLVIGSRMATALADGMPMWKYIGNRFLTVLQNWAFGTKLSEFHSGLRVYDAKLLASIDYQSFSDDFSFDSEMVSAFARRGYVIKEVPARCFYRSYVSSTTFRQSAIYGLKTLRTVFNRKSR